MNAYLDYICARQGHVVIVNATSTAPQPFAGGTCTRCNRYIKPVGCGNAKKDTP